MSPNTWAMLVSILSDMKPTYEDVLRVAYVIDNNFDIRAKLEGAKNTEQQVQADNSCEHSFSPVYQCVHCGKIGDSIA